MYSLRNFMDEMEVSFVFTASFVVEHEAKKIIIAK